MLGWVMGPDQQGETLALHGPALEPLVGSFLVVESRSWCQRCGGLWKDRWIVLLRLTSRMIEGEEATQVATGLNGCLCKTEAK